MNPPSGTVPTWKVPSPLPARIVGTPWSETLTARARLESPLKSPTPVAPRGPDVLTAVSKVTSPLPATNQSEPAAWPGVALPTTRSTLPSPLKSPETSDAGSLKPLIVVAGPKMPEVAPRRTLTVLSLRLPTAKSDRPSPLKSPTTIDSGSEPTVKLTGAWKVPSPLPSSATTLLPGDAGAGGPGVEAIRSRFPSPLKPPAAAGPLNGPPEIAVPSW